MKKSKGKSSGVLFKYNLKKKKKTQVICTLIFIFWDSLSSKYVRIKKKKIGDFPGGSVAETVLPTQGVQVRSLVGELKNPQLKISQAAMKTADPGYHS